MSRLPIIVGFGGINPAGRSSCFHSYRRLVIDALEEQKANQTYRSLAALMGQLDRLDGDQVPQDLRSHILDHTLIRTLESNLFEPSSVRVNKGLCIEPNGEPLRFQIRASQLPGQLPDGWSIEKQEAGTVHILASKGFDALVPDYQASRVCAAGQLPTGFNPEVLYQSRNHPRGLQLAVYAASDAVQSLGIDWDFIRSKVSPDRISVYASSAMGQLDPMGAGGLLQSTLLGKRISSKQLALSLTDMPADFVNAYVLGSSGNTGANVGACATFLYNLRQGVLDIRAGRSRVALVGGAEAPLVPEVIEGYRVMGALAEDEALCKLDGVTEADRRRACRPFSNNVGFTLSEAGQFFVLMDDDLAMELGATIYGAVPDVFANADGYKKSIPGPGIGNYTTVAKAMATVRSILGDESLKQRSYVQAHGTGTPQNRVTESHIFNELAKGFGIEQWPVAAIKCFLGHSVACASADQLLMSLGVWQEGVVPGIRTIDSLASDVHSSNLDFLFDHDQDEVDRYDSAIINSKGFGGNNASTAVLAPNIVKDMLQAKHGAKAMNDHAKRNEAVTLAVDTYDQAVSNGENKVIYRFGEGVIMGDELDINENEIRIPGLSEPVDLNLPNPFPDMVK